MKIKNLKEQLKLLKAHYDVLKSWIKTGDAVLTRVDFQKQKTQVKYIFVIKKVKK